MIEPDRNLSPLAIRLFGPFHVSVRGRPLPDLHSRYGHALLALLTLHHGAEVDRRWLAGQLWPQSLEPRALANLRNTLANLRGALGPEAARLRSPSPRSVGLDLAGADADVLRFDRALARGDPLSLAEAVELYCGPYWSNGATSGLFRSGGCARRPIW
jgi:DNA-binding SARP family transcriptional activator